MTLSQTSKIEWPDYLVIGFHFVLTVGVGLWAARRGNRGTAKGYFLAGRTMSWYLVGASLYVSNIGSSSFMGIGGAATANGIAVVCYEFTVSLAEVYPGNGVFLSGLFIIQLLGFVFVPVYLACGVYTTPEYIKKRFGGRRCNLYLSVQSLIMFVLTKLSTEIYAGALIIQATFGWDKYLSILVLLVCTALYTIVGGLASVIFTDALQTIVILVGGTILAVLSMVKVGGYEEMTRGYLAAVSSPAVLMSNDTCGVAPANFEHIFRDISDPNYPWPGVLVGANILSLWYFCTDQVLVQRLLSAKNTIHAKAGSIMAGYLKILPLFLMAWPGLIARVMFPETVACVSQEECMKACGIPKGCSNFAYVTMVLDVMPTGLRGLMLAAMLAALMSSLTSIFNSGSTLFTLDLWCYFRKNASNREVMIVSRLFVVVFVGVSIAWLPMVDSNQGQIFDYLQSITAYLAPPVAAVFTMGIMWTRANEQGSFWALLVGFVFGIARMIGDFALQPPNCGEPDTRPWIISGVHYLHYAIFLFLLSITLIVVVSLITKPPSEQQLYRTTWWTRNEIKADFEPEYDSKSISPSVSKAIDELDAAAVDTDEEDEGEGSKFNLRSCLLSWFCGENTTPGPTETEAASHRAALLSTKEGVVGKAVVEWNLVLLIGFGFFIWGFFA